jgi:hypothetical protein
MGNILGMTYGRYIGNDGWDHEREEKVWLWQQTNPNIHRNIRYSVRLK